MIKLFLASSFKDVAELFPDFAKQDLKEKRVTFIPTASLVESVKFYVGSGKKALKNLGMIIDELEISKASIEEIREKLVKNDYIYVTGGNAFYLLQELKKNEADKIIVEQIVAGKIYIGESAGSVIVSPNIEYVKDMDDVNKAPELENFSALNIVDFFPVPHHGNFPFKGVVKKIIEKYDSELEICPISNSQVILVNGNEAEIQNKK